MTVSYLKLLEDPRWRACSLAERKQRDYRCDGCHARRMDVQTHHGFYRKGLKPWEYPRWSLWVLCPDCHERMDSFRLEAVALLGGVPPQKAGGVLAALKHVTGVSDAGPTGRSRLGPRSRAAGR